MVSEVLVSLGPAAEVTPDPLPVPDPIGRLGTLETPVPTGLLARLDLMGYGAESEPAGIEAVSETETLSGVLVSLGPRAEVMPDPFPVPVLIGPLDTLETPGPTGLLPRLELMGYGAGSVPVPAGIEAVLETETPELRGIVGTTTELPIGLLGTLETPVPTGLLARLDLMGYGAESVPAGIEAVPETETPVLRGAVGSTTELDTMGVVATPVLRMTEFDVAEFVPLLVPEISDVDVGTIVAGEVGIDVVLA